MQRAAIAEPFRAGIDNAQTKSVMAVGLKRMVQQMRAVEFHPLQTWRQAELSTVFFIVNVG